MTYRRVTNCTVLNETAHTTTTTNDTSGLNTTYVSWGPSLLRDTNYTYSYSNLFEFWTDYTSLTAQPYQLAALNHYGEVASPNDASGSCFSPIPELRQSQADLVIAFLSFAGMFMDPVDAPWFSALRQLDDAVWDHAERPPILQRLYVFDEPVHSLACTEQHQFCTRNSCSKLLGADQVQEDVLSNLPLTPKQSVTFDRFSNAFEWSTIFEIVQYMQQSSTPLLALDKTATASFTVSFAVPDDQWQLEVQRWHALSIAHLQRLMSEWGTGQIAPQVKYLLPPNTDADKWLCDNLMINSTSFRSFSVLKLTLIMLGASSIILLSCTIEWIVSWLQLTLNRGIHACEMWVDHDMLGPQMWRKELDEKTSSQRGPSASARTYDRNWRHELDMSSLQLYSEKLGSCNEKPPT